MSPCLNAAMFRLILATAGGACLLGGCASPPEDYRTVSRELERRGGHGLTNAQPGQVVIPSGVTLADGLSEDEAVALALLNNAAFQEALSDLGLSRADVVQAGMLPNPTLSMLFPVGAKPLELTVKYPVEALWLRPRRVAAAKLDYERTEQRLTQSGLDLVRDVRLACADLTLASERFDLLEGAAALVEGIAEQAQARLRAGEGSELEAASARNDALQAREQSTRASQDVRLARERLRGLAGLGPDRWPTVEVTSPLPSAFAPDVARLVTNALSSRPDLRGAELGLEAAGRRVGLAKAEIYTFSVGLNAKEVGADLLAGPALDVPIPLVNQNQGGIAQARAKFVKAARQYATVRDRIVLEVRDAHLRLSQAGASHAQWQQQILPPLEQAVAAVEISHAAGNVAYLSVLENRRRLSEARLKAAAAAADVRRARAELERCVGRPLAAIASEFPEPQHEAK